MVGDRTGNVTAADTLLETLDSLHGEMREAIAAGDMDALGQLDQQRQDMIAAALPDHATAGHVEKLAGLIEQDHALQQELASPYATVKTAPYQPHACGQPIPAITSYVLS